MYIHEAVIKESARFQYGFFLYLTMGRSFQ